MSESHTLNGRAIPEKRSLLAVAIALLLALFAATTVAAQSQAQEYRTKRGDTLASIARQYCTTWQDIYYLNQGILGTDPNDIEPGVLIYVYNRCKPASGVYDRGPSTYAGGYVIGDLYYTARGDTWYSIGVRFGLPWADISAANGDGSLFPGRQLRIPGLNQGQGSRPPAVTSAVKIVSPQRGATLPRTFTVSGNAQGLIEGNVMVRALDRFGNVLAQSITTAKGPDIGAGGAGTWSTELTVNVPPGSPGQLVAIGGANAQDIVAVGFGGVPPPATNPELSILNPPAFAALPQRFIVNGTAQGIGWSDIVVQAVDNQGRVLTEVRTRLQGQDVGAGGPGTWSVPLDVYAAPGTPGKIRVFVAGTNLNLSRDVTFSGQGAGSDPSQSSSNITRFTVDRQQISPGECVTFYWNTRNTQSVYFYREGEQWQSAQVDPNPDHFSACPKSTSTHYLRVTGNDGLTEIRTMPIWVGEQQRGGPGPVIPTLSANPASVSANSRCTTLTWTTSGSDVSRVTLFRNGQVVSGAGAAPSYQDCVPDAALGRDITYELRVDSQNSGWTTRQVRVTSAKG